MQVKRDEARLAALVGGGGTALLDEAPYGAIVASTCLDGPCWYVNPAFVAITGYDLDDLPTVGDWVSRAYPDPTYRAFVLENWARDVDPAEMDRDVVYRIRTKAGGDRDVQLRARMLGDGAMLVQLVDVTVQETMRRELAESEARYRCLVDDCPVAILVATLDAVLYTNAAAVRLFGALGAADLVGRSPFALAAPAQADEARARVERLLAGEAPSAREYQLRRLDESPFTGRVVTHRVTFGGVRAVQVCVEDVTAHRVMEQRILQAQKAESLALLAGGVAHDFNNLLVGVLGAADLALLEAGPESVVGRELERVILAARAAAELSGQLLAYAGKGCLSPSLLDVGGLLTAMLPLLRSTAGDRADLTVRTPAVPVQAQADATGLRQILLNLVGNAVDALACDGGQVHVELELLTVDQDFLDGCVPPCAAAPGPYVCLRVRDAGRGMDEATRSRMFDPFFSTKRPGRGLGLAAVAGIVRSHGGALRVSSTPGKGTTVEVFLPQSARDASRS